MPGAARLRHAVDHITAKRLVDVFGEATLPKKNTHPGLTKRVDVVSEQLCGISPPIPYSSPPYHQSFIVSSHHALHHALTRTHHHPSPLPLPFLPPGPPKSQSSIPSYIHTSFGTNTTYSDDIISYLAPTLAPHHGCLLIDIHPGSCLFSTKLHAHLRPRRHLLMEPEPRYFTPFIKPLLDAPDSNYRFTPLPGAHPFRYWDNHPQVLNDPNLLGPVPTLPPGDPGRKRLNPDILVIGSLTRWYKHQHPGAVQWSLMAMLQLMNASLSNDLFHRAGLVRMLWWTHERPTASYLFPAPNAYRQAINAHFSFGSTLSQVVGCEPHVVGQDELGRASPNKARPAVLSEWARRRIEAGRMGLGMKIPGGKASLGSGKEVGSLSVEEENESSHSEGLDESSSPPKNVEEAERVGEEPPSPLLPPYYTAAELATQIPILRARLQHFARLDVPAWRKLDLNPKDFVYPHCIKMFVEHEPSVYKAKLFAVYMDAYLRILKMEASWKELEERELEREKKGLVEGEGLKQPNGEEEEEVMVVVKSEAGTVAPRAEAAAITQVSTPSVEPPPKRRRGRPRKTPHPPPEAKQANGGTKEGNEADVSTPEAPLSDATSPVSSPLKRRPGRPAKVTTPEPPKRRPGRPPTKRRPPPPPPIPIPPPLPRDLPTLHAALLSLNDLWDTTLTTYHPSLHPILSIHVDAHHAFHLHLHPLDTLSYPALQTSASSFHPKVPCMLLDIVPKPHTLGVEGLTSDARGAGILSLIVKALFTNSAAGLAEMLDRIAPNAAKDLVPMVPAMGDPRRGGRLEAKRLRVRLVTAEMLEGLVRAWAEWPFRPLAEELELVAEELGVGEEDGDEDEEG